MSIVVIAHPRSGSNSVVEILRCQPGVTIANEPFCDDFARWDRANVDYQGRLRAGECFSTVVGDLLRDYTGLKELSYQLEGDHLRQLVQRPDVRVVTLRRRNVLQSAVSQLLAERTGVWKTWDVEAPGDARYGTPYPSHPEVPVTAPHGSGGDERLAARYRDLAPLDVDRVRDCMAWMTAEVARIDDAVAGLDVHPLHYEDLHLASPDVQAAQVDALWRFLGFSPIDSPRIAYFLSPAVRQARPSTYGQLPNLAEIEAALGDDATGHLDL